jgi:hypothetical protein
MACADYPDKTSCNGDTNCQWVGGKNNGSCQDAGEICDDGVDNDGDGLTDCDDSDCVDDPACLPATCDNDGFCEPGEDCVGCSSDCAGVTGGKPANRFCCGNGVQEGPEGDGTVCDNNY